jgi:hypothetical protein
VAIRRSVLAYGVNGFARRCVSDPAIRAEPLEGRRLIKSDASVLVFTRVTCVQSGLRSGQAQALGAVSRSAAFRVVEDLGVEAASWRRALFEDDSRVVKELTLEADLVGADAGGECEAKLRAGQPSG